MSPEALLFKLTIRWCIARERVVRKCPFPDNALERCRSRRDPGDPDTRAALAALCEAYWYPVYALIRRLGHAEADALDLTQEYFARLLERSALAVADPACGRFRNFLRTDCRHFLGDARDRDRARKRGGGRPPLSIDARDAEVRPSTSA